MSALSGEILIFFWSPHDDFYMHTNILNRVLQIENIS